MRTRDLACLCLFGLLTLATASLALACPPDTVVYVDSTAAGANDGTTWVDAYTDLQTALVSAPLCTLVTQIWVAQGTYLPTSGVDRSVTFQLVDGLAIYGGFDGTETDRSQRDIDLNVTILSGDIGTPADSSDNSYHVVTGSGTDATAVLDGFTITRGQADGANPDWWGGGMHNDGGSPTLVNLVFSANAATTTQTHHAARMEKLHEVLQLPRTEPPPRPHVHAREGHRDPHGRDRHHGR